MILKLQRNILSKLAPNLEIQVSFIRIQGLPQENLLDVYTEPQSQGQGK